MKNKKILLYALVVFILAGVIVVLLKGFNVDLMLRTHDSIEYTIGKDFNLSDIKQIAKEIFGNKKVVVRTIEVFNDSVSINALEITEEEKNNLISKLDEKYGIENVDDREIEIISNPGIRLREIVKPYIIPTVISFILIYIIYLIRFYKQVTVKWKEFIESVLLIVLLNLAILSLIAITRIPINTLTIPVMLFVTILSLILYFENQSNIIEKEEKESKKKIKK
ncbi:MAG: hypothetical protein ACI4UE_06720 [Candidatus Scatovivens sp.]